MRIGALKNPLIPIISTAPLNPEVPQPMKVANGTTNGLNQRTCNCTVEDLNNSDGCYHWPGCPRFAHADSVWWSNHPEKAKDPRTSFFRESCVRSPDWPKRLRVCKLRQCLKPLSQTRERLPSANALGR